MNRCACQLLRGHALDVAASVARAPSVRTINSTQDMPDAKMHRECGQHHDRVANSATISTTTTRTTTTTSLLRRSTGWTQTAQDLETADYFVSLCIVFDADAFVCTIFCFWRPQTHSNSRNHIDIIVKPSLSRTEAKALRRHQR